ncbi:hypothetical protein HUG10_09985 [Halorarum halophilum]|uniref:Uncharacterized protein n=1 Tax=Halorarum halophilum TaxID=2743090 RepID=A0A7D5KMP3_9EURY|nr:hypothetical protein [Halobaculum halophilum]QLG27862.1 hypothetical protein HUG10_09985 [Halobaculum halophilum]
MSDIDAVWNDLRQRIERLEPGAGFVTPVSDRPFRVEATFEDRVSVRFRDSGEERQLWREQFGVFVRRLDDGGIAVADLPPGVEPYASVVTLLDDYAAADGRISHAPGGPSDEESPYLVSPAEARTRPERLHDDALLLADLLDRLDATDPPSLDTDSLADLYVLLSDVQHESDRLRQSTREPLLDRLGPNQALSGRFGTVRRTTRERRRPKDDETVLDALDEHGIPHEWVLGVDADKLDVVLAVTDLTEEEVYDADEQVYVQKTDVDETEKFSRLRGLADRIDQLEGAEGEKLREELTELEAHLDEALSA